MYLNVNITIKKVSICQFITYFQCNRYLREYCMRVEGQWGDVDDAKKYVFQDTKLDRTAPVPHTYIYRWQKEQWERCL